MRKGVYLFFIATKSVFDLVLQIYEKIYKMVKKYQFDSSFGDYLFFILQ